jgi:HEAT repeat protein
MSGSDETAKEARRLASERAFTARRFLAALDRGGYTNVDLATVPAAERDLALPALRAMARQRSGVIRLNAARALVEFGDRLGGEVLIECLQSEDSALRKGAIDRVSWLEFRDSMRSHNPPFDADALLVALEPSLADPDRWNRKRALSFVGYLETPKAFDRLVAFLGDARPDMRAEAACMLGDAGHDRGALAVIEDLLRERGNPYRYFLIRALEHLCKSTDADLRSRAAAVAIGFIRSNLDEHRQSALDANSLANDVWHCMDGIAAACSPEQRDILNGVLRQVLHEVLASKLVWWIRGMALTRLAQMEGQAGVARLIAALSDPDLRKDALEGLASLAAGSNDPAVLATLGNEIEQGNATHISALIKAFLAVGGNAKSFRAVIDGLNGILDGLGRPERFIELSSGTSDVAIVTFARADIFMPLALELGIRLGRAS